MKHREPPTAAAPESAGRGTGTASPDVVADLTATLGGNLRRLRLDRRLSLDGLSRVSGVSRAMLSQVELGRSAPTINVLWKIAHALGVPFSALLEDGRVGRLVILRAGASRLLASQDGAFTTRALFPSRGHRPVEFYELRLRPNTRAKAEPHQPETTENLVVAEGSLTVALGGERHQLEEGDAVFFYADLPHEYWNEGVREARAYLVMTYERRSARANPP